MATQKECTLIIVGRTGSGKSSFGNSLLGQKLFEAKMCGTSVTSQCQREKCMLKDGTLLTIVDTPGLFDTKVPIEKTKKEISRSVALCAPGPHVILFVLGLGRFTQEEIESVDTLMKLFGKESMNHFIVVFTGKDQLDGDNLDEFVRDCPKYLTDFLKECNSRYVGIANNLSSPTHDRDVNDFMKIIYKTMEQNGYQCYSKEAFAAVERVIQVGIEKQQQKLIEEEIKLREKSLEKDEIQRKTRREKVGKERTQRIKEEERERLERNQNRNIIYGILWKRKINWTRKKRRR